MRFGFILFLILLLDSFAHGAVYTIGGRCHFLNDEGTSEVRGDDHNFPEGTLLQLFQGNSVVDETLVGIDGRYSFTIDTAPTAEMRVRVHLWTMRSLSPRKGRVHMRGRFKLFLAPGGRKRCQESLANVSLPPMSGRTLRSANADAPVEESPMKKVPDTFSSPFLPYG